MTSWLIFGISIVQLCASSLRSLLALFLSETCADIYYISFPTDRVWMKALGTFSFTPIPRRHISILSLLQCTGCSSWTSSSVLSRVLWVGISSPLDGDVLPTSFSPVGHSRLSVPATASVRLLLLSLPLHAASYTLVIRSVATTVQLFYAWRIWVLKRWLILPGIISVVRVISLYLVAANLYSNLYVSFVNRSLLRSSVLPFRSRPVSRTCKTSLVFCPSSLEPLSGSRVVQLLTSCVHFSSLPTTPLITPTFFYDRSSSPSLWFTW